MQTIEIITKAERHRRWSEEVRAQILAECAEPGAVVTEVARRYDIRTNLIYKWRRQVAERDQRARAILDLPATTTPPFISYGEIAHLGESQVVGPSTSQSQDAPEPPSARGSLEILAPNGFRLFLWGELADTRITQALRCLRAV